MRPILNKLIFLKASIYSVGHDNLEKHVRLLCILPFLLRVPTVSFFFAVIFDIEMILKWREI